MSYCINCGAQLPDHAKFCNECGTKQETVVKSSPVEEKSKYSPAFQDVEEEPEYGEEQKVQPETPSFTSSPEKAFPDPTADDEEEPDEDEDFYEDSADSESGIKDGDKPNTDEEAGRNLLRLLSSAKKDAPQQAEKKFSDDTAPGFTSSDYADDPYWDDVKPEIDNEIYQIDRSMILKGVGCVCALFLVIAYLIYMI